jgi:hypothetical protein
MTRQLRLSVLVASLLATMMLGIGQSKTVTVYGSGSESCGAWTAAIPSTTGIAHNLALSWVYGFMSGAEAGFSAGAAPVRKTDGDGVEAWMAQYCAQHPLETVAEAAGGLVRSLRR